MEVPPTVWADLPRIILCFVAVMLCEKLWKWIQHIQIKVDKPKHEVSLPELVTNLVSVTEMVKPEEENEKYVDALEQNEATRPKILAVSPQDPKMDTALKSDGMQQQLEEWDSDLIAVPNMDTALAPLTYQLTQGQGMPIVYDREGLSESQQITLENLRRRRARNQRQQHERARQGTEDEKEQETSDEVPLQESRDQNVAGRGRASLRARPRPAHYNTDRECGQCIPGGYEDIQNPKPYDFITANVDEHYTGNRPTRKWPNQAALLRQELRKLGEQNPEWAALVSAAQDVVTEMDTTWPEVHMNVATSYRGGASNWNPPQGLVRGQGRPRGRGHGQARPMNHE